MRRDSRSPVRVPSRGAAPPLLFSYSYKALFRQLASFHNHPYCPGGGPLLLSKFPAAASGRACGRIEVGYPMTQSAEQSLAIRLAQEADVPLVLDFIRKLAEYGDLSSEVSATEDDVRAALFGPKRVAEAVLAFLGSQAVGFALYTSNFSSFAGRPGIYIEDLFVENEHRGRGVGKALLVHMARLGRERGCARLEWSALNWNERAMEFYQDLGAVAMDEWTTFNLNSDAMQRLAEEPLNPPVNQPSKGRVKEAGS